MEEQEVEDINDDDMHYDIQDDDLQRTSRDNTVTGVDRLQQITEGNSYRSVINQL